MKKYWVIFLGLFTLSYGVQAQSLSPEAELTYLQHQWAVCQYQVHKDKAQQSCLTDLVARNRQDLQNMPEHPEIQVWLAINLSSLAGSKGGIGALSLVKEAKKLLEQVIDTAPSTLSGSAYTSLGALYYQVPGWPIGFGSDKKAKQLLKQALKMNPDGLDSNFFYADFLLDQGDKKQAKRYFLKALQAAPRANRPLADQGRRAEIQKKLQGLS
ncbi:tetratricopeptide repeat protein [Celerinatantimonas sp. YJH-8]|uniref:tetratricopeptide repeat protein n=1 Tax=Celerinatantimonas sp. YJH-8 TaxID=3228714 RepID=UPI0038C731A7